MEICANRRNLRKNNAVICELDNPRKIKNWYTDESNNLTVDVFKKNMESFFKTLETELEIDSEDGPVPFGPRAINWQEYEE